MKLQVGLQDTMNVINVANRIQDPIAKESFMALAKIVDALVVNMRSMSGQNIGTDRGNIDPDVLVFSIQDLLDTKVIKEFTRKDLSNLLEQTGPKRYIATTYGESSGGKLRRRGGK